MECSSCHPVLIPTLTTVEFAALYVVPEIQYIEIIATNIKTDPKSVNKKNLNAE